MSLHTNNVQRLATVGIQLEKKLLSTFTLLTWATCSCVEGHLKSTRSEEHCMEQELQWLVKWCTVVEVSPPEDRCCELLVAAIRLKNR